MFAHHGSGECRCCKSKLSAALGDSALYLVLHDLNLFSRCSRLQKDKEEKSEGRGQAASRVWEGLAKRE